MAFLLALFFPCNKAGGRRGRMRNWLKLNHWYQALSPPTFQLLLSSGIEDLFLQKPVEPPTAFWAREWEAVLDHLYALFTGNIESCLMWKQAIGPCSPGLSALIGSRSSEFQIDIFLYLTGYVRDWTCDDLQCPILSAVYYSQLLSLLF